MLRVDIGRFPIMTHLPRRPARDHAKFYEKLHALNDEENTRTRPEDIQQV